MKPPSVGGNRKRALVHFPSFENEPSCRSALKLQPFRIFKIERGRKARSLRHLTAVHPLVFPELCEPISASYIGLCSCSNLLNYSHCCALRFHWRCGRGRGYRCASSSGPLVIDVHSALSVFGRTAMVIRMITARQIRAARALLDWSHSSLPTRLSSLSTRWRDSKRAW